MGRTAGEALERLVSIMRRLRAEGGCPWDREQDLRSLRPYLVEETYEVLDEMDRVAAGGRWAPLGEELGDLLFQIVFHAQLASELGEFSMGDVCEAISNKLESRHPHVFGDAKVEGSEQVLANWAQLKAEERKRKTGSEGSVLDGVPSGAPSLLRAERLTEKASRIGFDWPDLTGVRGKLDEELRELDEAIASKDRDALEHELGDVLFSLANLARFIKTPAEDALRGAIRRFTQRFHHIEAGLRARSVPFGKASLDQMESLWQEAKGLEKEMPSPRHLPRASVRELSVPVSDLPSVTKAWDALGPRLGLERRRAMPSEARYESGNWTVRFVEAPGAPAPGIQLELEAPSRAAVQVLRANLEQHGMRPTADAAQTSSSDAVTFVDPAGIQWRYGLAG